MHIALCDDEAIFRDDLASILDKIAFQQNIDFTIDRYTCGEALLTALTEQDKCYDLIFLDILMKDLNGVDTAKAMRQQAIETPIIFLTSTIEFALSGYDVKALNYLIKPATLEKVQALILSIYEESRTEAISFTFNANHTVYSVPLKDINYFEVNNRIIYIKTVKPNPVEAVGFYRKLDELEDELRDKGFARCHRSYLIHLKNISSVSSTEVLFTNQDTVPVSRRLYKTIKDAFLELAGSLL